MATSTNLTIVNNISLGSGEAKHFIFFQGPVNPELDHDMDLIVWRTLNIQNGGKGNFPIAFEAEYTASVKHDGDSTETSQAICARNGDLLIVTKDPKSDAPILTKPPQGLNTESTGQHVTVQNDYDGVKQVVVRALKNGKPLIEHTLTELHGQASFHINSFMYMAWHSDLKEGDSFKSGTYSSSSAKIDLIDSTTHLAATNITVTVVNEGNVIETQIDYL